MKPIECDLALAGGTLVTLDDARRIVRNGVVAIAGERIVAVGTADETPVAAARTIDCSGAIVMPGLIDCHTHLFHTLARGLGEGLAGWDWLVQFIWPYAEAITPEETLAAVRLGAIEALRSGATAVLDHHYGCADVETTLAVADVLEAVGLRGVVARGIAGPPTAVGQAQGLPEHAFSYSQAEELEMTAACMDERPAGGRIAVWPAPINIVYTDQQLLRDAVALARERGAGWHTHFCAPSRDPEIFSAAYGVRPAEWLDREGLLGPDATLAHCTWLNDSDVEQIGGARTGVVHCPTSNQYMPYGVMRLRDLRNAGATVALGTDGAACGHRQDVFEQIKATILLQRVHHLDPTVITAEEAIELATLEGGRVLGIEAGALRQGLLADVIVVDVAQPHAAPLSNAAGTLAYAVRGSDVRTSIIGGEVVFEDGRCTRVDEESILAEAEQCAQRVLARANIAASTGWVGARP